MVVHAPLVHMDDAIVYVQVQPHDLLISVWQLQQVIEQGLSIALISLSDNTALFPLP